MRPIRPNKKALVVFVVILAAIMSLLRTSVESPDETPLDRAYRECRPCGISDEQIAGLIDNMRHSTLTRAENVKLFLDTFHDPADAENACRVSRRCWAQLHSPVQGCKTDVA